MEALARSKIKSSFLSKIASHIFEININISLQLVDLNQSFISLNDWKHFHCYSLGDQVKECQYTLTREVY